MLSPSLSPLTIEHLGHGQFLTVINTQPHTFLPGPVPGSASGISPHFLSQTFGGA